MTPKPREESFGTIKAHDLHEGVKVVYHPVGHASQTSVGEIVRIITHPEEVGSRHTVVKASEEEPRYVIRNDHTHKEAAYKHENIVEIVK